jgi:hypothetical protein
LLHGDARKEAQKLGVPLLGEVLLDIAIPANSDEGARSSPARRKARKPCGQTK